MADLKITYQRDVSHCEVSKYVQMVTIKTVQPAKKSDFLDAVTFVENSWNAITGRGIYKAGDKVYLIPPDSVIPFELGETMNITNHLSHGRVRIAELRKNRSEGLVVDPETIAPYLDHIMHWEDIIPEEMAGIALDTKEVPYDFRSIDKIQRILNFNPFNPGDQVYESEKIHGQFLRMAKLPHPETGVITDYVGMFSWALEYNADSAPWKAYDRSFRNIIPEGYVFYGELFGAGIQRGFHYDREEADILVFGVKKDGEYLSIPEVIELCDSYNIPRVDFELFTFEDVEQVRALADRPSELTKSHVREGIVMVSADDPKVIVKCHSFKFLTGTGKKNKK